MDILINKTSTVASKPLDHTYKESGGFSYYKGMIIK